MSQQPGPLVLELFPRLKERRTNGGNPRSGSGQQMLSIPRALMGDLRLLLMDVPLVGLAPLIIDQIVQVIHRLRQETDRALPIVE